MHYKCHKKCLKRNISRHAVYNEAICVSQKFKFYIYMFSDLNYVLKTFLKLKSVKYHRCYAELCIKFDITCQQTKCCLSMQYLDFCYSHNLIAHIGVCMTVKSIDICSWKFNFLNIYREICIYALQMP